MRGLARSSNQRSSCSWKSSGVAGAAALADFVARDHAARDYEAHLKASVGCGRARSTWRWRRSTTCTAIWGPGPASVRREELPQTAARALDREEQERLLRSAERAGARDRAIVVTLLSGAAGDEAGAVAALAAVGARGLLARAAEQPGGRRRRDPERVHLRLRRRRRDPGLPACSASSSAAPPPLSPPPPPPPAARGRRVCLGRRAGVGVARSADRDHRQRFRRRPSAPAR